jgi:hypothetical protein
MSNARTYRILQEIHQSICADYKANGKLLRKDTKYQWNDECQHGLDTLKENMVTTPILVFPYWEKTFHVHVDASTIALGAILVQQEQETWITR